MGRYRIVFCLKVLYLYLEFTINLSKEKLFLFFKNKQLRHLKTELSHTQVEEPVRKWSSEPVRKKSSTYFVNVDINSIRVVDKVGWMVVMLMGHHETKVE